MSDTPTYASLLTRLFSGSPEERAAVIKHLTSNEHDRTAAEAEVRARLRDSFPWLRLVAAETVFRVYKDTAAAVEAVGGVLRDGDPAAVADAAGILRQLGPAAVPLLVLMVRHAPDVFTAQTSDFQRWAGNTAVRNGPDGLSAWLAMLEPGHDESDTALLIGMAYAAPEIAYDLSPAESALRSKLAGPNLKLRAAAGAALWRATWRVNRDWLASLDPNAPGMAFPGLRDLLVTVLVEHLGRKPDVSGQIREMLTAFAEDSPLGGSHVVARLARLGSRGWGVLIPMLHPPSPGERLPVPDRIREAIYTEAAARPAVLPLVHHHAHGAVLAAAADGSANSVVAVAARVLANLGPAAGMAVPDLLNLAVRVPSTGQVVGATVAKLAPGFPNAAAAVVRALHRLRAGGSFGADQLAAFEALARTLAELDPDAGPALVENTAVDPRVAELLLQHPAWKDAAPETRTRHARLLADSLGSRRAEVRIGAAEMLRHYRAELPAVWPALVAVLAGSDEKAAVTVLPHFRHLAPAEDEVVPELLALFREKNPAYAARAFVALWRLGRMADVADQLREAIGVSTEESWGWLVLRGVVGRVGQAHRFLRDLNELFAASPPDVSRKVAVLVNPVEPPEDGHVTRHVPRPDDPAAPPDVDWDGVYSVLGDDPTPGVLLFLALMCEYGSAGFRNQKIWMIKTHRELTRAGLAESKGIVERVIAALERPGSSSGERRQAVRDFFAGRVELPREIAALLDHRLGWVRWAGLELADSWGLTSGQARELTEERAWDASPRVRERALRMIRG